VVLIKKEEKEIKVRIFIKEKDNEYVNWDTLTPEKQKEIGMILNDNALRAIGYEPESKDKTA
jgi:hypothetical protein